jgi:hypothetical protein
MKSCCLLQSHLLQQIPYDSLGLTTSCKSHHNIYFEKPTKHAWHSGGLRAGRQLSGSLQVQDISLLHTVQKQPNIPPGTMTAEEQN